MGVPDAAEDCLLRLPAKFSAALGWPSGQDQDEWVWMGRPVLIDLVEFQVVRHHHNLLA